MAIPVNDGIRVEGPKPAEDKRLNNGIRYTSVAQANALVIKSDRYLTLEVIIETGGISNVYWWKDSIEDTGLVLKLDSAGVAPLQIFDKNNNSQSATMTATDKYIFGEFGIKGDTNYMAYSTPIDVSTAQHIYIIKDKGRTKSVLLNSILFDIKVEGRVTFEKWKITGTTATRTGALYSSYTTSPIFPVGSNEVIPNEGLGFILQPDEYIAIRMQGSTQLLGRVSSSNIINPLYDVYLNTTTGVTNVPLGTVRTLSLGIQFKYTIQGELVDHNNAFELQDLISVGGIVNLPAKTYNISTPLLIQSGTFIKGVKGRTIINYTGTGNFIYLTADHTNITIQDIIFNGGSSFNPSVTNATDVKSKTGIGSQNCFFINGNARNIYIERCVIKYFNGCGFKATQTHLNNYYNETFKLTNNVFNNNFIGLLLDTRAEYHQFIGNSFNFNQIGAWIEGGNNYGSNNHFNANSVGCVISGLGVNNDTHGSISASSINHNLTYSIFAVNINNGFAFIGCQTFQGAIYIENSRGFIFTGGEISANIISASESDGYNIISNNIFKQTYSGGIITGSPTKLSMNGNRFIEGTSSTSINNLV
ncbi:hypothetical protein [Epilithonimonas sp.]|uniref:hypothetical protein n=1 Tax=Epilithonimonas sp. TaxID=2894511 RepID=UPI0035B3B24C